MRAYLIDELPTSHMDRLNKFLKKNALSSSINQLFWVRIPEDLLSETQFQHRKCWPHVFAVELGLDWVKLEFFVRSLHNMRCSCPAYCTAQQRVYIIDYAHRMIEHLGIKT